LPRLRGWEWGLNEGKDSAEIINLRSDTQTLPTEEMLRAITVQS